MLMRIKQKLPYLLREQNPEVISKNLAELKSTKISKKFPNEMVLGADSVVSLNNQIINKPKDRSEAFTILKKLNGKNSLFD